MSLRKTHSKQGRGAGPQTGNTPRDPTAADPAGTPRRFGEAVSATGPLPLGLIALSLALAAGGFAFDLSLPLGVAGGIPYVALVLVGLWGPWRRYIFVLAVLASVLTILGYFLSPAGGEHSPAGGYHWEVLVNRALALFAIWAVALLGDRYRRELRQKSALLETTFENMSQGIIVTDSVPRLIAFNQKYADLLGFPPGFLRPGMPFEKILRFQADRGDFGPGNVEEIVRQRLLARQRKKVLRRVRTLPDGRFIAIHREPMPDGCHVTTLTDVTAIKQAEEALRESEARLVNAQRIARLGDWERNPETGEVHWSDQMYDIFAIAPEQFAGTHEAFLERVHPDDRELVRETTRRALSEDAPIDVEYRIVRPDTSERVIHSHGEVEFDAAGKPVRMSGTAQDITERKSLEEQIRQIQKFDAVGKLAGGVAHEFNNLLFVIKGNSDLLEARLKDNPELQRHIETISRQTKRGSYLTRLLVAYARSQPLRPKEMDINDVVRETAKLLKGSLSDAIEIDTVCAENLWTTLVDRGELECAIVNLAVNAQDAMPDGGKLTVETVNIRIDGEHTAHGGDAEPGEYVRLAITDTGCGMAAVVAARAFEPFFTTKEIGKGTGLGLSMVYGFVKQSGGYVTIDSELAHGTTVSVYLPKAEEARA